MKITGYRLEKYIVKMDRPIGDANYPSGDSLSSFGLLFLETDEGITGIAPGGNDKVGRLFEAIEGEDPRGVIGLWKKMVDYVFKSGNEGDNTGAIAAIDIALWDIKAKLNEEPLWQTLGALEGKTKAYASDIGYCLSDTELHNFYSKMASKGIDAGKLKIGLSMEDDLRRIKVMKDALSTVRERPFLMLDVNEYWSPKQTIRYLSEIEKQFDIFWIEEPGRRWDYQGLNLVSKSVKAAVATGENTNGIADITTLIANQAVDMLNVSSGHSGITGCRQSANIANAYEIPVTMMNCQANFMAHLAAALPNHSMMEVVDPGREQAFSSWDNQIEDGFIVMGNSPGLGIEVNDKKLQSLKNNKFGREPITPFPRRKGAGLYIEEIGPKEVKWKK